MSHTAGLGAELAGLTGMNAQAGTAYMNALMRAAHQVMDGGRIYIDPYSLLLVDQSDMDKISRISGASGQRLELVRTYVAARSRFVQECFSSCRDAQPLQLVVLGSGLDMIGYAAAQDPQIPVVYEVDRGAVLEWKASRMRDFAGPAPQKLHHVPIDLECEDLASALATAGHNIDLPSFFCWTGVVPYLSRPRVARILNYIGSQRSGSAVVFDYALQCAGLGEAEARAQRVLSRRVERFGEPFCSRLTADEAEALTKGAGFEVTEHLHVREVIARYGGGWPSATDWVGNWSRLILAVVP